MKQLNILGEIDIIDSKGKIIQTIDVYGNPKECEICKKPSPEGDCCSEECATIWVDMYININQK